MLSRLWREWLFFGLVAAYCIIYLAIYPASYSISDESCIIALAQAIRGGSVLLDSPMWGLAVGARIISKYSAFHAAVMVPALIVSWRAMFLVAAAFFVLGAFVMRAMLRRAGVGSGWCVLYFMLAGALYYSQTVMAAVPAAVVGLIGVSLCLRDPARPFLAGLALGAATLLHPWMAPFAVIFTVVWSLERGGRILSSAAALIAGALPSIAALMAYNHATTGSAFRDVYTILGHQYSFGGEHLLSFFIFYFLSFAVFPLAGWSAFSRRWSGTWAIPAACAVTIAMASLYYYRDGLNVGSARVGNAALIAGLIPGQRFLIPASMLACLPAARFLRAQVMALSSAIVQRGRFAALGIFAISFFLMSLAHQSYLSAHAKVQQALIANLPHEAKIVTAGDAGKEFAPASFEFTGLHSLDDSEAVPPDQYFAVLRLPGGDAPPAWVSGHAVRRIPIRSWVWNRDLLIGSPVPAR
jgi:hypothetical protein